MVFCFVVSIVKPRDSGGSMDSITDVRDLGPETDVLTETSRGAVRKDGLVDDAVRGGARQPVRRPGRPARDPRAQSQRILRREYEVGAGSKVTHHLPVTRRALRHLLRTSSYRLAKLSCDERGLSTRRGSAFMPVTDPDCARRHQMIRRRVSRPRRRALSGRTLSGTDGGDPT